MKFSWWYQGSFSSLLTIFLCISKIRIQVDLVLFAKEGPRRNHVPVTCESRVPRSEREWSEGSWEEKAKKPKQHVIPGKAACVWKMLFTRLGPPVWLGFPVAVTGNTRTADVGAQKSSEWKQQMDMEGPFSGETMKNRGKTRQSPSAIGNNQEWRETTAEKSYIFIERAKIGKWVPEPQVLAQHADISGIYEEENCSDGP